MKTMTPTHNQRGYIALISTLLIGSVGLAIALSVLWLGLGDTRASQGQVQAEQAKSMADYCGEMALLNTHDNLNYYGGDVITNNGVTCTIVAVTGKGNRSRVVEVTGSAGNITRKVEIIIDRVRPQIKLISWREVADF
jgi:hypothetical protein